MFDNQFMARFGKQATVIKIDSVELPQAEIKEQAQMPYLQDISIQDQDLSLQDTDRSPADQYDSPRHECPRPERSQSAPPLCTEQDDLLQAPPGATRPLNFGQPALPRSPRKRLSPDTIQTLYKRANEAVEDGKLSQAVEFYLQILNASRPLKSDMKKAIYDQIVHMLYIDSNDLSAHAIACIREYLESKLKERNKYYRQEFELLFRIREIEKSRKCCGGCVVM